MFGEAVIREQCVKHRFGNHVLRQHFDDFFVADGVVEVVAQFGGEAVEGFDFLAVLGVFQNGLDAVDVGFCDFGNVTRPIFPMMAVAAFFDDFCIEGAFDCPCFKRQGFLYRMRFFGLPDVVAVSCFA